MYFEILSIKRYDLIFKRTKRKQTTTRCIIWVIDNSVIISTKFFHALFYSYVFLGIFLHIIFLSFSFSIMCFLSFFLSLSLIKRIVIYSCFQHMATKFNSVIITEFLIFPKRLLFYIQRRIT